MRGSELDELVRERFGPPPEAEGGKDPRDSDGREIARRRRVLWLALYGDTGEEEQ